MVVRVSLCEHTTEIHGKITQAQGSFAKTIANIKNTKNGIVVSPVVILMRKNEKHVENIKNFLINIRIFRIEQNISTIQ